MLQNIEIHRDKEKRNKVFLQKIKGGDVAVLIG